MDRSTPGFPAFTTSWSFLKLMSIESVMPSNQLILCRLLLPSIFPASGSFLISWLIASGASASALVLPMNIHDYSLISFRIDWFDLLAVQETLKSLIQHHSSKASILWCPAFFMVQLSHPHMTTAKTIALTRWTFVGKAISLLFSMMSRLVIAFLPRSKCLLILWLQSLSAVILEPQKIKSDTVFTFSPSICHEMMEPDAMIFTF